MRYLHPVGIQERFVASGIYIHYQDGNPTGTVEHWSIHEMPDGAQKIRVDDDWRETDGSSVLIEAWRSPYAEGGRIERFDLHAFGGKNDPIKEVRATFQFFGDHAEIGHTVNNGTRQQLEIDLPQDYIVAPESLIFGGFEVAMLAVNPGYQFPVVSYLPTFYSAATTFRPTVYEQSAVFLRDESISIDVHTYAAHCFEQYSPSSDQKFPLWTDEHDILLKFISADQRHSAILTRYARRVEPHRSSET